MYLKSGPLLLLAVLCAPACGDNTIPVTPTTPGVTTTETFADTLTINGARTHQFTTTSRGPVTARLTSVGPDSTTIIGVSLGTWNGIACQIWLAKDETMQGVELLGQVTAVGNLCLRVYDVGRLTAPATYSVDVTHP
jgi:hypothetical protein